MFQTVPLSIIRSFSLHIQQTCMTYTIAVCKVIFGIKLYMFRTVPLSIIMSFHCTYSKPV